MQMMSLSQMSYETVKMIYKHHRKIVDMLVKVGEISKEAAESEWARRVAKELLKRGYKIPSTIAKILK